MLYINTLFSNQCSISITITRHFGLAEPLTKLLTPITRQPTVPVLSLIPCLQGLPIRKRSVSNIQGADSSILYHCPSRATDHNDLWLHTRLALRFSANHKRVAGAIEHRDTLYKEQKTISSEVE